MSKKKSTKVEVKAEVAEKPVAKPAMGSELVVAPGKAICCTRGLKMRVEGQEITGDMLSDNANSGAMALKEHYDNGTVVNA